MRRNTLKLISLVLVMAMVLSFAAVASADYTMYATQSTAIRKGAGSNYSSIGTLNRGDKVIATGEFLNGWAKIRINSYEVGYVNNSHLTYYSSVAGVTTPSTSTTPSAGNQIYWPSSGVGLKTCSDCGDTYYATTALNVRSGPGTNYSIIGSLSKNQQVTKIGQSGNWYKLLTTNGTAAYASASYLKPVSSGSAYYPSYGTGSYTSYGTYYTTTGLNVRKGPSTGYSIVTTLSRGESVTYLGEKSGDWLKVRTRAGYVGWCHGGYLSSGSVGSVSGGYVTGNTCGYCGRLYYGTRCTYCYNGWYWGPGPGYAYPTYPNYGYAPSQICVGNTYTIRSSTPLYGTDITLSSGARVQVTSVSSGSTMVNVWVVNGPHRGAYGSVSAYNLYY